jgi:hypothetical protein
MSTATTSVEVGQIRQDPRDDTFVLVEGRGYGMNNRLGWRVRPVDRLATPTGALPFVLYTNTLNRWALIGPDTITEPQ